MAPTATASDVLEIMSSSPPDEPSCASPADWGWVIIKCHNPRFVTNANQALRKLASLKKNWDGYGSPPIDRSILTAARKMVHALGNRSDIPTPHVVPLSDGNLQFEWHHGGRCLEIEIETPTRGHYLKWDPDAGIKEEEVYPLSDTDQTIRLIKWFLGEVVRV